MAENQITHSCLSTNQTDPIIIIEEESLFSMLSKQTQLPNTSLLQTDTFLAGARTKSVDWILKLNTHHSFSTATAVLAVNYFDGLLLNTLLFQNRPPPWTIHLAAVACLSLAAKMEETHFPNLSDFQVEKNTNNVFETKTIHRMEILVLSKLQWRMNPVTPLSFLSYIAKRLEFNHNFSGQFLRRCECILLDSVSDCRFMGYLPSIMAASIATLVIIGVADEGDIQDQIFNLLQIKKGEVDDCCKMIIEAVSKSYFCGEVEDHLLSGSPKTMTDGSFSPNGSDLGDNLSHGRSNKDKS